jgi:hypothetical protein
MCADQPAGLWRGGQGRGGLAGQFPKQARDQYTVTKREEEVTVVEISTTTPRTPKAAVTGAFCFRGRDVRTPMRSLPSTRISLASEG